MQGLAGGWVGVSPPGQSGRCHGNWAARREEVGNSLFFLNLPWTLVCRPGRACPSTQAAVCVHNGAHSLQAWPV